MRMRVLDTDEGATVDLNVSGIGEAPGEQQYTVHCDHGDTTLHWRAGERPNTEAIRFRQVLERHDREKGCECSRTLWGQMAAKEAHL